MNRLSNEKRELIMKFNKKIYEIIDNADIFEAYINDTCFYYYIKIARKEYSKPIYFYNDVRGIFAPLDKQEFYDDIARNKLKKCTDEEEKICANIENVKQCVKDELLDNIEAIERDGYLYHYCLELEVLKRMFNS